MTFNDLPENWPTLPLTDPAHVADVLDVFVDLQARASGSLLLLLCDDLRRPIQPILIDSIDERRPHRAGGSSPAWPTRWQAARRSPRFCARSPVAMVCRPRSTTDAGDESSRKHSRGRVELLGVHLVTFDGSVPIGAVDEAA